MESNVIIEDNEDEDERHKGYYLILWICLKIYIFKAYLFTLFEKNLLFLKTRKTRKTQKKMFGFFFFFFFVLKNTKNIENTKFR